MCHFRSLSCNITFTLPLCVLEGQLLGLAVTSAPDPVLEGQLLGLAVTSAPDPVLECPQEAGKDVVILKLLTEDQSLHAEKKKRVL